MDSQTLESFRKDIRTIEILLDYHEKKLACHDGLSLVQFHFLFVIKELKCCSMKKLAEDLSMDKSKVSRTIDRLVKIGLVNRKTDPNNRRLSILTLTDSGKKIVTKINNENNMLFDKSLARLPNGKKDSFVKELHVFTKALKDVIHLKSTSL